ncbi:CATRA system-associated protein [Nonomuraea sp. MG754425]|uniref:CATRA system-associated protein n=1 Tax=Nonomuraea sp. MG754425 TaxID=2570319 RepID=UPI001F1E1234|nr:CATRA system-associated protein [Nonomuraea sp. MG754425]
MNQDVVRLLGYVRQWKLSSDQWAEVEVILDDLQRGHDQATLLARLKLLSPVRVRRSVGDVPEVPPPPLITERLNRIMTEFPVGFEPPAHAGADG